MKKIQSIGELFRKLHEDDLSQEERNELRKLIKTLQDDENTFNNYLSDTWRNSSSDNAEEIDSLQLLKNIHNKISTFGNEHSNSSVAAKKLKSPLNAGSFPLLKYAAVGIIAFTTAWFLRTLFPAGHSSGIHSAVNEVSVSYGSRSRVVLPDGSVVFVNSGSRIKYPSDFSKERVVYIDGEAYFDVKKDPTNPFYVKTSDISIKVLGTVFNVKSYPEENIIETTLVSGVVELFNKNKKIGILKPNEKAVYVKKTYGNSDRKNPLPIVQPQQAETEAPQLAIEDKVKTDLYVSWKDNRLVFDNERFALLKHRLERWYNIEILNLDPELEEERFSGKFDKQTIEQALTAMSFTIPFKYKMEKNKITIYR